jgi:colanic acid biosynthesis glycosyl transferase WcaI
LEIIIHAANQLKKNKKFKFIISGFGQYKAHLEKLADDFQLDNVDFLPLQDKSAFNEFLNMGDLHMVIQKSKASDLALPSKITTILAVGGVCIVTAFKSTSLYHLVTHFDIGFTCDPDNPQGLADALIHIERENLDKKRNNANAYAVNYINIEKVMNNFLMSLND